MSAPLVCLVVLLSSAAPAGDLPSVYPPDSPFEYAIRGQTPGYDEAPPAGPDTAAPFSSGEPQTFEPYNNGSIMPNMYGPPPGAGPYAPGSGYTVPGANGPQPYRWGWTSRYDLGYLPSESTEKGLGDLGIFELNAAWQYNTPSVYEKVISFTPNFGMRAYDGPTGAPGLTTSLPGEVYHIGTEFELSSPLVGQWNAQIAFSPSINTDFKGSLGQDAWQFDARGQVSYNVSRQLIYVIGAAYWDRVDDLVVPNAGVIWMPDDRWEYRLVFPDPRISYFMGNLMGFSAWGYVRAEWHVEAYELQLETTHRREHVEIQDWRVLAGIRKTNGIISEFYEVGWVFDRKVEYARGTPGFDVSSGLIVRAGLQY